MTKKNREKEIEYLKNISFDDDNNSEDILKLTLSLHEILIRNLFLFWNKYFTKLCKEENIKKIIEELPKKTIEEWREEILNKIDTEMKEFWEYRKESSIGPFISAMNNFVKIEEKVEQNKKIVNGIADSHLNFLAYIKNNNPTK